MMSLDEVLDALDQGIVGKPPEKSEHCYRGFPGKEIFFLLPSLDDASMYRLAQKITDTFLRKSRLPKDHIKWGNFIRYIYGCFEKDGILRDSERKKTIANERPDWSLPIKFMKIVADLFEKQGERYGLMLHCEMLAHRIGDMAVTQNDPNMILEMEALYHKSHEIAFEIKSPKHQFSPLYWCARYMDEAGYKDRAVDYYLRALKYMERHCPDDREGYQNKAISCFEALKAILPPADWEERVKKFHRFNNKCLKKAMATLRI